MASAFPSLDHPGIPFCKHTMNLVQQIELWIGNPTGILSRPGVPAGDFLSQRWNVGAT
jgi:hypothetical protein